MHRVPILAAAFLLLAISIWSQSGPIVSPDSVKQAHARLHSDYHGPNILNETKAGHDVKINQQYVVNIAQAINPTPAAYPDRFLVNLMCHSAQVAVAGVLVRSESSLTEAGDFLFTDSLFRVESVIKGPLMPGAEIIVTRPGGAATINGRQVSTQVGDFPPFQANTRYALLLEYLPDTGTYRAFSTATFMLGSKALDHAVKAIDPAISALSSLQHESNFLTELRAASTAACLK